MSLINQIEELLNKNMNDFLVSMSSEFNIDIEKLNGHWRDFLKGACKKNDTVVKSVSVSVPVTATVQESSGTCNYKFSKGANAGQFCTSKPKVGNFCSKHKKSENSTPKEKKEPKEKKKNIVSTKSPSPSKKNLMFTGLTELRIL